MKYKQRLERRYTRLRWGEFETVLTYVSEVGGGGGGGGGISLILFSKLVCSTYFCFVYLIFPLQWQYPRV